MSSAGLGGGVIVEVCYIGVCSVSESIECFLDGQAFSRSYGLALRPPPPPDPPLLVRKLHRPHTGRLTKRDKFLNGGVRGAETYDRKKAWSSINRILLFVLCILVHLSPNFYTFQEADS